MAERKKIRAEYAKRFGISAEIKDKLSTISRATVERLLAAERKKHKLKGKSATKKGGWLKSQIPVRVFWRWDEKQPGFCDIYRFIRQSMWGLPGAFMFFRQGYFLKLRQLPA